jgi:phosphatidate cytidylyltransferase
MLKQRIITALVMLAVLLSALFWPSPLPFAVVTLLLISAAGWEWARLNGCAPVTSVLMGAACLALCLLAWHFVGLERPQFGLWAATGAAWVLLGGLLLRAGVAGWPRIPRPLRLAGGLLALALAWLALAQARVIGINFVLSVLALVWAADICAYFAGRAFGLRFTKSRLAPTISPGKSWEGVWGGMVGVLLLALCWVAGDRWLGAARPSLYSLLAAQGWWLLLLAPLLLSAMSVVGDLFESLIKRSAGAKDSSALLPGHGGVLDRVDALLPTLPLAMMLASAGLR